MINKDPIDWLIIVFGLVTCLPLLLAQLTIIVDPKGNKAKDILIGKGQEWRDKSHFKSAYSLAIVDWVVFLPCFAIGVVGVVLGAIWGYFFLGLAGAIQLYINVFLWFFEKEYVYPANGALRYFTYIWGNFVYWGVATILWSFFHIVAPGE